MKPEIDYREVARLRQAQHDRQAVESWNYLNINDPRYPELTVTRARIRNIDGSPLSVNDVRKAIDRLEGKS